jgi:hypothetical protein
VAKKHRGPLTGIRSPEYDSDTPWQAQQVGRFARGFFGRAPNARSARRLLVLIFVGFLLLIAIGTLISAVLG